MKRIQFLLAIALAATLSMVATARAQSDKLGMPPPARAAADQPAAPACLEKLNLSPQQRDQIKAIVGEYDADITSVWNQFTVRYKNAVDTETLLLAAIEDNLTDAQRAQVRDQRRNEAQHEKSVAGTNTKPNQAATAPASAVEESIAIVGVSLTPEQQALADAIQEKYLGRLRSLNRDIQGLHARLVSLEADKLVEIEKVLTKDQLQQLHEIRQSAPEAATKTTASNSARYTQ